MKVEKILEETKRFLKDNLESNIQEISINLTVPPPGISYSDLRRLVLERGYHLSCVCGHGEKNVTPILTKRVMIGSVEIVNTLYCDEISLEEFNMLKKKIQ